MSPTRILFALTATLGLCAAAVTKAPADDGVDEALRRAVERVAVDSSYYAGDEPIYCRASIQRFYVESGFEAEWTEGGALTQGAREVIDRVTRAGEHGLRPADYHARAFAAVAGADLTEPRARAEVELLLTDSFLLFGAHLLSGHINPETIDPEWIATRREGDMVAILEGALASNEVGATLDGLAPHDEGYVRLRASLKELRGAAWPVIPAGPTLRRGDAGERVRALRARLIATGELSGEVDGDFDEALDVAVRRFQRSHALDEDGVVGAETLEELNVSAAGRVRQIMVNLERWRWMPNDLGQVRILVNIANYHLTMEREGETPVTMRVIVGKRYRRTPVFSGRVSYLVLNPAWEVPRNLAVEDVLPAVRAEPDYLTRLGFQVFAGLGPDREISPDSIEWGRLSKDYFPYRLRQKPGPLNALGTLKVMFPNKFKVYLHDTPSRGLFARPSRTFSSGCIRVEDPVRLAAFVLDDPEWTVEKIKGAIATGATQTLVVHRPVDVHVQYWTAWVDDDGVLQFRRDIYGRDQRLLDALREEPPQ